MFRWEGRNKFFSDELRMLIEKAENDRIISMIGVTRQEYLIDSRGTTLLHLAARYNNKDIISHLITVLKWKVDVRDSSGASPLKIAAANDNCVAVESLLNANADPLLTDNSKVCALGIALRRHVNFGVMLVLLLKKVRENTRNNEKFVQILLEMRCPPSYVIFLNDVDVTRMFWKQKYASPNAARKDRESINSVIKAAMTVVDGPHFDFLLQHYDFYFIFKAETFNLLSIVVLNRASYEILQRSIYKRSKIAELFEIFTKKIIELNLLNETTSTNELAELSYIFRRAEADIIQALLATGIVEHFKNKIGYDLRLNLFANAHQSIRELALNMTGYDVSSRNYLGQSALHVAVSGNFPEVVEKLLYLGADPDALDKKGRTPAFYLFYTKTYMKTARDCLELLLRSGANVQICDIDGKTFIETAFLTHPKWTALEPAMSKLAMLTVMGLPVKQSILDCVNSDSEWRKYYDDHLRELYEMTKKKIFRSLSIFTLISRRPARMARFVSVQIEEINKALRDPDCACKDGSYYYPILNWNIKEALKISKLRDKAVVVIETNIEQLQGFALIIDKIVEFLSYKDLLIFE